MGDESPGGIAELLCAVSFATSLGLGEQMEHGLKSAYIGLRVADALGLGPEDREAVYYGALLKDAGCTACATAISAFFPDAPNGQMMMLDPFSMKGQMRWMRRSLPLNPELPARMAKLLSFMIQCNTVERDAELAHCEVAEMTARRLGFPDHVQQTVRYQFERWDGKGYTFGLKGNASPVSSRVLLLVQMYAFGLTFGGPEGASALVREGSGRRFDPDLTETLVKLAGTTGFGEMPRPEVLAMRPPTVADKTGPDAVCEALADIADRKYRGNWYHSPRVAELSVAMGERLGINEPQLAELRRAALVHDLGQIAVPAPVLQKTAERMSEMEWELYRLHPYHTQRVLEQVGPLRGIAEQAASHHEWVNGEGYHRGVQGDAISLGGRIIAVADAYTDLTETRDGEALAQLKAGVGTRFDADCVDALAAALGGAPVRAPAAAQPAPSTLSDREAEVLGLLAQGMSNGTIAKELFISRRTVDHHLDHIYGKLGVSCRTSAVAYAMQHRMV